jgi:hypothetical protein
MIFLAHSNESKITHHFLHVSQDLLPTTHNKIWRRQREEKASTSSLNFVVLSMATMKKIILCVLLSFFFSIYSTTCVHSCRDSGIQITGVVTTGGVPDHSTGLPFHPWIMTVAEKWEATQATTKVKSQTSRQGGPVSRAEGGEASTAVPRAKFEAESLGSQHWIGARAEGGKASAAVPRASFEAQSLGFQHQIDRRAKATEAPSAEARVGSKEKKRGQHQQEHEGK